MRSVLVTGASGFIGAALTPALARAGLPVRAASRRPGLTMPAGVDAVVLGELGPDLDWSRALEGVGVVIHLAGPAHALHAEGELHRAIVEGTARLVEQARRCGVERLVFVSSIKAVAGASGSPLTEQDAPAPADAYGKAKRATEAVVLAQPELHPIVLRPPLVHGPEAKGNVRRLLGVADTALPLPLAGIENQRSLISLDALVAAIIAVVRRHDGPNGVFHLADRPALSTGAIIAALRQGLGRPARLFAAPGARLFLPRQMTESLVVDDARFRAAYGYGEHAGVNCAEALAATAAAWKGRRQRRG